MYRTHHAPCPHFVAVYQLIAYKALQQPHNRHCWCPTHIPCPCHPRGHTGQPSNCRVHFPAQGSSGLLCPTPLVTCTAGWKEKELTLPGSHPPALMEGSWWINTPPSRPLRGKLSGMGPTLAPRISLGVQPQFLADTVHPLMSVLPCLFQFPTPLLGSPPKLPALCRS